MGLMGFAKFMQKRPSDKTIRVGRIIFGSILIGALYYNLIHLGINIDNSYIFGLINLGDSQVEILKYIIVSIGLVPIIMGAFNICLLKKKYIKIVQIIFGFLLFYIAGSINSDNHKIGIEFLVGFMGILPIIAGITGKCITKDCLRYREKLTKIRV